MMITTAVTLIHLFFANLFIYVTTGFKAKAIEKEIRKGTIIDEINLRTMTNLGNNKAKR